MSDDLSPTNVRSGQATIELHALERLSGGLPDLPPVNHARIGILSIPVIEQEPWTAGFDIADTVIVDLTADLAIASIDLPRPRWTRGAPIRATLGA